MSAQIPMFHDTWEDARDSDINALGGRKKAAARLWPGEDEETAQSRMKACCAPGHKQELKPSEILRIKAWAKEAGSTAMIDFEARTLHFDVVWISPEEEDTRLRRAFVDAVKTLEQIQRGLTDNGQRIRSVK